MLPQNLFYGKIKLKNYDGMKAKDLHVEMKRKKLWVTNAQFLTNADKIRLLEHGLDSDVGEKIVRTLEEKMIAMRVVQSKHISETKSKPKRVTMEVPEDAEVVEDETSEGKIVDVKDDKTWEDESAELGEGKDDSGGWETQVHQGKAIVRDDVIVKIKDEEEEVEEENEDWFDDFVNEEEVDDDFIEV